MSAGQAQAAAAAVATRRANLGRFSAQLSHVLHLQGSHGRVAGVKMIFS